jgi:hypothetical protein
MPLPVATLLAVSLYASGPLDLYAPTGTAMAVQSPADPALPEGCYGVATADRTGLPEEDPSVWTCEVPADGTDVLAAIDLVGGSWHPVLLRWWDGAGWVRFAEAPKPEALTRVVKHVATTDGVTVVPLYYVPNITHLAPQDGDGVRVRADCYISAVAPTAPPYVAPAVWSIVYTINCQNPGPQPPYGYNYDGWCGTSNSTGFPPTSSPLSGITMALDYNGWVGAPGIVVRGKSGMTINWGCEVTVQTTAVTP